jgi:hypothetical protein
MKQPVWAIVRLEEDDDPQMDIIFIILMIIKRLKFPEHLVGSRFGKK